MGMFIAKAMFSYCSVIIKINKTRNAQVNLTTNANMYHEHELGRHETTSAHQLKT